MGEKEFAMNILNLNIDMYKNIKVKNGKSVILKEKIYNENIESIRQELVEQKLINKAIDYSELKELYLRYGSNMSEKEFATDVLDLSLDSYRHLRCCNKDKFRILKKEIQKEFDRIKKNLISKGYSNKKIYYDELRELYLAYGSFISERQFAMQSLSLNSSSYQAMKYQSKKNRKLGAIILPYKKLTVEDLEKIRQELIAAGFENKKMSVCEIDELYQKYSDVMTKSRFLEDVLGIYYYVSSLPEDSKITILKKRDVLDDSTIEQIKQLVYKEGYYYKKIKPKDTYDLYEKYGNGLTYNTFIYQVLGITRKQIYDAEKDDNFVRIINKNVKNIMELVINTHLQEVRYYSQEEILNICKMYNINLRDFILYSLLKTVAHNHDTYIDTYLNILKDYNQLWIGNSKISNDIISKYYYEIENKIYQIISSIRTLYPMAYEYSENISDDFQDLLLFFIENGSEIEKNFMVYDDSNWSRYLYGKLKRKLLIKVFSRIGVAKLENKTYWQDENGEQEKELIDKNFDTEEIAISNISKDVLLDINNCVLLFGKLLIDGNNINEAKKIICDKFDISELEFGNYMKSYMEKHNSSEFDLGLLNIDDKYSVSSNNAKKFTS